MVTIEQHQALLADCKEWLDKLREQRSTINHLRNDLYVAAAGRTEKDFLTEVEHYHNQFHIQQINIHDLKHQIKHHIHEAEKHPNFGHKIPHLQLEMQYQQLVKDIDHLAEAFQLFINSK